MLSLAKHFKRAKTVDKQLAKKKRKTILYPEFWVSQEGVTHNLSSHPFRRSVRKVNRKRNTYVLAINFENFKLEEGSKPHMGQPTVKT